MKFLSYNGLIYFWGKVKAALNTKADTGHKHGAADITSGTLPLARGGTGATTAEGARKALGAAETLHTHSNYVNQNAFSNVAVGNTTIVADSATDTLTLAAGSNVILTADAAGDKVTISATDTNTTYGVATTSTLGLVKSGTDITVDASGNVSVLDDSHNHIISNVDGLQSALDAKAASSHTHANYVNQNAFSNVTVGSTTIAADSATDSLTLAAGSNVTLTPDATNDKITISATDTKYTHPSYTSKTNGLYKVTVDGTGHVSATSAVTKADITALGIPAQDTNTTYSVATTGALGLVKSGTDITVDANGNVSVVDDSHNHVISNVDGLQTALNGKANSLHIHQNYMNQNAEVFDNTKSFNVYINAGQYRVLNNYDIDIHDGPEHAYNSGTLLVFTSKSTTNEDYKCVTQIYLSDIDNENYPARYRMKDGDMWSNWRKLYNHVTGNGNEHIPAGGSDGQILKWSGTGKAKWADLNKQLKYIYKCTSGTGWSMSASGGFWRSEEIYCPGIDYADHIFIKFVSQNPDTIDFDVNSTLAAKKAFECVNYVRKYATSSIRLYCYTEKPSVSFDFYVYAIQ